MLSLGLGLGMMHVPTLSIYAVAEVMNAHFSNSIIRRWKI